MVKGRDTVKGQGVVKGAGQGGQWVCLWKWGVGQKDRVGWCADVGTCVD